MATVEELEAKIVQLEHDLKELITEKRRASCKHFTVRLRYRVPAILQDYSYTEYLYNLYTHPALRERFLAGTCEECGVVLLGADLDRAMLVFGYVKKS